MERPVIFNSKALTGSQRSSRERAPYTGGDVSSRLVAGFSSVIPYLLCPAFYWPPVSRGSRPLEGLGPCFLSPSGVGSRAKVGGHQQGKTPRLRGNGRQSANEHESCRTGAHACPLGTCKLLQDLESAAPLRMSYFWKWSLGAQVK